MLEMRRRDKPVDPAGQWAWFVVYACGVAMMVVAAWALLVGVGS